MSIDGSMRAAVIDRTGPPESFRISELPVPSPGSGEVLVRASAVGCNAIDWKTRAGAGISLAAFPAVLGWDVSGTVVGLGPHASRWQVGDEVFGMLRFPEPALAYAQYVTAPEDELAARPGNVGHSATAGAMLLLTAWQTVFEQAGVAEGDRVLVHGAAGGVGHVVAQFARVVGAEVIGTASARNRDFLAGLGVSRVVDYTGTSLEDDVHGIDVVIDTRGGADFVRLLGVLRPGGVIVTLLGRNPGQEQAALAHRVRAGFTYVKPDGAALGQIAGYLADGSVQLNLDHTFPLADVGLAHRLGEQGHVRGLLVLEM